MVSSLWLSNSVHNEEIMKALSRNPGEVPWLGSHHCSAHPRGPRRPSLTGEQASQTVLLHSSLNSEMAPTWTVQWQVVHTSVITLFPGWNQRHQGQASQQLGPLTFPLTTAPEAVCLINGGQPPTTSPDHHPDPLAVSSGHSLPCLPTTSVAMVRVGAFMPEREPGQ